MTVARFRQEVERMKALDLADQPLPDQEVDRAVVTIRGLPSGPCRRRLMVTASARGRRVTLDRAGSCSSGAGRTAPNHAARLRRARHVEGLTGSRQLLHDVGLEGDRVVDLDRPGWMADLAFASPVCVQPRKSAAGRGEPIIGAGL